MKPIGGRQDCKEFRRNAAETHDGKNCKPQVPQGQGPVDLEGSSMFHAALEREDDDDVEARHPDGQGPVESHKVLPEGVVNVLKGEGLELRRVLVRPVSPMTQVSRRRGCRHRHICHSILQNDPCHRIHQSQGELLRMSTGE